jgi:hypothetical protein
MKSARRVVTCLGFLSCLVACTHSGSSPADDAASTGGAAGGSSEAGNSGSGGSPASVTGGSPAWGSGGREGGAASDTCAPPPDTACAVRLYPQCNFEGKEVCVPKSGYFDAAALAALGLPRGQARSLRVAPGYYARLDFAGSQTDGWDTVIRGEDACLYNGAEPSDARAFKNVKVVPRALCRKRPRVFMALHGSNALASTATDDQWAYVREHLDGIWENTAGISSDEMAAIYRKVKTRVVITEQDGKRDEPWRPLSVYGNFQKTHPDIVLVREAMAIYKNPATEWNANDAALARAAYVDAQDAPDWLRYQHLYGGFQPQQFMLAEDDPNAPTLAETEGKDLLSQMDGAFFECAADTCKAHLKRAIYNLIEPLHSNGRPFIWFNGTRPEEPLAWFKGMQRQYFMLESEGVFTPKDVVMIINYWGKLPSTPEVDAEHPEGALTATGMLYWLLHQ